MRSGPGRAVQNVLAATLATACIGYGSSAAAVVVGSFGEGAGGGTASIASEAQFKLFYELGDGIYATPFFDVKIRNGEDTVKVLNSGPVFEETAALMTNGIDNFIEQSTLLGGGAGGIGKGEASWLFGDFTGASGIDLEGFDLTSFNLLISNVSLDSSASDPNGSRTRTDYSYDWHVDVHAVPLPPALPLLAAGIGLIFLQASRKRRTNHSVRPQLT